MLIQAGSISLTSILEGEQAIAQDGNVLESVGVSVDCAASLSALGKRTWWRKIQSGKISKLMPDAFGRTRVPLADALRLAVVSLSDEDIQVLLMADAGDADAQDDIGQFFLQARFVDAALYWLQLAVKQGHANSMQILAGCYARGDGFEKNEQTAIKWLREAAMRGHSIGQAQLAGLNPET